MNEETIRILRDQAARITTEIREQVVRRAGSQCEGWIEDPRMELASERCEARKDLDFCIDFYADISGDPLTASDVRRLCEYCYDNSDIVEEWAHFDHLITKDD